jgi:hypothetical protein
MGTSLVPVARATTGTRPLAVLPGLGGVPTCVWRVPALVIALALLAGPASATASERRIAEGGTYSISTYRGWILWTQDQADGVARGAVLWRGSRRPFHPASPDLYNHLMPRLGSDGRGRTAVIYMHCRGYPAHGGQVRDCDVVRQRLDTRDDKTLLHAKYQLDVGAADLSQGNLAIARGESNEGIERDLFLLRPGLRDLRLSSDDPFQIDIEAERLVYAAARRTSPDTYGLAVVRAVDLRTRGYRTLASYNSGDNPRAVPPTVSYNSAATDGRYAYWLRSERANGPNGTRTDEVFRASLIDDAPVTKLRLEHPATSITAARGRIYYTSQIGAEYSGVYEVADPVWQRTGQRTPAH